MATYNGERHLAEQIESILDQTWSDWRLLIRDDGSRDGTSEIIDEYARLAPDRIVAIRDGKGKLGLCGNFSCLLEQVTAPYAMLSDQDDVWLPGKIALTLHAMRYLEDLYPGVPLLVHTDKLVVDENLKVLDESAWKCQRHDPFLMGDLNTLAVQPFVSSNSVMLNRPALQIALPVPADAEKLGHDWWIAACVAQRGMVVPLCVPTVKWRQHGANLSGVQRKTLRSLLTRVFHIGRHLAFGQQQLHCLNRHGFQLSAWALLRRKAAVTLVKFLSQHAGQGEPDVRRIPDLRRVAWRRQPVDTDGLIAQEVPGRANAEPGPRGPRPGPAPDSRGLRLGTQIPPIPDDEELVEALTREEPELPDDIA
jgi:hypothetical protein